MCANGGGEECVPTRLAESGREKRNGNLLGGNRERVWGCVVVICVRKCENARRVCVRETRQRKRGTGILWEGVGWFRGETHARRCKKIFTNAKRGNVLRESFLKEVRGASGF